MKKSYMLAILMGLKNVSNNPVRDFKNDFQVDLKLLNKKRPSSNLEGLILNSYFLS